MVQKLDSILRASYDSFKSFIQDGLIAPKFMEQKEL